MPELAEIFRRHGSEYLARFGDRVLPSHRRAVRDIVECRTPFNGGHVAVCNSCGKQHQVYHSCRNRSCPKCHGAATTEWIAKRESELLPVRYFHVIFTLPKELRPLVRRHQRKLLAALATAAAKSLTKLAADKRYVGGTIGVLAVIHTWARPMAWHPHVHCLVPGGGLSADGSTWFEARKKFLVPARALSKLFRSIFMAHARKALPDVTFPQSVWQKSWVAYCKHSVQGPRKVVRYLARYVHRIAITNNRILAADDHKVVFQYYDSRDDRSKTMTLPPHEFMRRFLQHVLPRRFHKVRYYGLLSPSYRATLKQLRATLLLQSHRPFVHHQPSTPSTPWRRCPACNDGRLTIVMWIPKPPRKPP